MNIFTKERVSRWFFFWSLALAKVSVITAFAIGGFEIYIRWSVNQNFTFLGGGALEALIISSFGLVLGLNYINRAHKE